MRSFVELQRKAVTPDSGGGRAVSWETERQLYCRIKPLSGTKRMEAMSLQSSVTHQIETNYAPDVEPRVVTSKRIVDENGAAYNIQAAWFPENVKEFVVMLATSGVAT